jgi:hypothetical protein
VPAHAGSQTFGCRVPVWVFVPGQYPFMLLQANGELVMFILLLTVLPEEIPLPLTHLLDE